VVTVIRSTAPVLDRAREIADDVLFPAALGVDAADRVPPSHLDLFAAEGFYGLAGPPESGGLGVADIATAGRLVEILANGCLTTTFVWMQHHGAVLAAANSALRDEFLEPLCRGRIRAGVALAGIRPGRSPLQARAVDGGYVLDGDAPWVTGWGMVNVLHTAALADADTVVWCLLDAVEGPSLTVEPLRMSAVNASRTVHVRFTGHHVPAERVTGSMPYQEWLERDAAGLRLNGSLSLGVAKRCCRLIGPSRLDDEVIACRTALDAGTPQTMPEARAAASELAMRAASALAVTTGSRAVLADQHAQRLVREAAFLLVFGSRLPIREALLRRLERRY
jgi:alkylation response protein AidB-like acyl-CoA dehydrogenase